MATITVRRLDPTTWEPQQGNGLANFISDLDAVTQILATRLRLFTGEWILDVFDGLPLFQTMLGSSGSIRNIQIITNLISSRITKSPFVTGINSISVTYLNRNFQYSASVGTQFGSISINNTPASLLTLSSK